MREDTLVIRMQSHEVSCSICGQETPHRWGVPTVNGDIVSNDFPEDLWGQYGGGMPACKECYAKHQAGELPTWDRYYLHLAAGFIGGAGI